MAHRRSFRGRGISDSQRRKRVWGAFSSLAADATQSGTEPNLLIRFFTSVVIAGDVAQAFTGAVFPALNSPGQILPESTILRIRGSVELPKNVILAAEYTTSAFGMGVMEAGAALQGAFPNPASPEGANWDGWMFYRTQQQGALDANAGIVDVKAMRKIESGYALVMVMGNYSVTDDGTVPVGGAIDGFFSGRGLFLLP